MQSQNLSVLSVKDQTLRVVGVIEPIKLTGHYDENQAWFPFMEGTYFNAIQPPVIRPHDTKKFQQKLNKTYAALPADVGPGNPYVYEEGVPQYVLPFREFKRVSSKQLRRLRDANFPTWDIDPNTSKPRLVKVNNTPFEPAEWCADHFEGRYCINNHGILCEREDDAIVATLTFS